MTIDARKFRNALGNFATGICVVTTARCDALPIGMTINSFASVSLEPPLVLWSIQNSSDCLRAFTESDRFAINVLASDQENLSQQYAMRGGHELTPAHYSLGRTGSPVLKGALNTFECKVWARYPGGDHQIIVGEVLELKSRPTGRPLVFHQGKYARLR